MKQTLFSIVLIAILCGVVYATPVSVGKRNEEMHQQLTEPELAKSEPYHSGSRGKRDLVEKQKGIANEIFPASEIANSDYADAAELANSGPGGRGGGIRGLVEKQRGRGGGGAGKREAASPERGKLFENE